MALARLIVKNAEKFRRDMKREETRTRKASETAARVEGFRLMKLLKQQIMEGAPGGRPFEGLTEIGKRLGRGARTRKALKRLAVPVRYGVDRSGGVFRVSVGYLPEKISKKWVWLAEVQQEGRRVPVTEKLRRGFALYGAALKKGRNRAAARYFFLRKETRFLETPARPIIDPFWGAHEREARQKIQENFERKMAGQRI